MALGGRRRPLVAGLVAALLMMFTVGLSSVLFELRRAERAESVSKEKLRDSYLAQAQAARQTLQAGRRETSLTAVRRAAAIRPSLELRNEAIAALALSDLGETTAWLDANRSSGLGLGVELDPSGEHYASIGSNGLVRVFRVSDHRELAAFSGPTSFPGPDAFSPDGRFLATTYRLGEVRVWDLVTHAAVLQTQFTAATNFPALVEFSPDSRQLAVAGEHSVQFWDLKTGERLPSLDAGENVTLCLDQAWKRLAALAAGQIQIWDLETRQRVKIIATSTPVSSAAWHPDGRRLAASYANGEAWLWDTQTGDSLRLESDPSFPGTLLAFHPSGGLLMTSRMRNSITMADQPTRFWDAANGRSLFSSVEGGGGKFLRDGRQTFRGREWSPDRGYGIGHRRVIVSSVFKTVNVVGGANFAYASLAVSPDGRWIASSGDDGLRLWDSTTWVPLAFRSADHSWPAIAFHPDSRSIIAASQTHLQQYPLEIDRRSSSIHGIGDAATVFPDPVVMPLGFCSLPDGEVVALRLLRHEVELIDLKDQSKFATLRIGSNVAAFILPHLAISPDRRWVATVPWMDVPHQVWVSDAQNREPVRLLDRQIMANVVFSPDNRTLVTTSTRDYCFWNTDSWTLRRRVPLSSPASIGAAAAFTRDGHLLAMVDAGRTIKLLHPSTGDELATLIAPDPSNISCLAFNGDGSVLIAGADQRGLQIWDLRELRRELTALKLDWNDPP